MPRKGWKSVGFRDALHSELAEYAVLRRSRVPDLAAALIEAAFEMIRHKDSDSIHIPWIFSRLRSDLEAVGKPTEIAHKMTIQGPPGSASNSVKSHQELRDHGAQIADTLVESLFETKLKFAPTAPASGPSLGSQSKKVRKSKTQP